MVALATRFGRYGYRRVTALLRQEGWRVNHKRVERLWRQEGLKVPQRQPKPLGPILPGEKLTPKSTIFFWEKALGLSKTQRPPSHTLAPTQPTQTLLQRSHQTE